jgi:hypothetical protein
MIARDTGGVPLPDSDPLEGGDTEPNAILPDPEDITGATRCCTECGAKVMSMATCPIPRIEDIVSLAIYWERAEEPCTVSGAADAPVWWFCPRTRWFGGHGVFRVRVERI